MLDRKIVLETVSTELPRKCGIAIFTKNLINSAKGDERVIWHKRNSIVQEALEYNIEIRNSMREINQNDSKSWGRGLEQIIKDAQEYEKSNREREEIIREFGIIVNFEYGIYGDQQGNNYLVPLLKGLHENNITNILIPHTVLSDPDSYTDRPYRKIMEDALRYTDQILCLTRSAVNILEDVYDAPRELLTPISHGINKIQTSHTRAQLKKELNLEKRTCLITGGFLSDGKDIKTVLEAIAMLKKKERKDIIYFVLGITHPDCLKKSGEKFRDLFIEYGRNRIYRGGENIKLNVLDIRNAKSLYDLKKYNLKDYDVVFLDAFLSDEDSLKSKIMSDLVVIPNKGRSQISSGEVASAVEAMRTYVATSSPYTEDMARVGVGFTVEHENVDSMYRSLKFFLGLSFEERKKLELASATKGATMYWPDVTKRIVNVIDSITYYKRMTE